MQYRFYGLMLLLSIFASNSLIVEHNQFATILNYLDENDFHKKTLVLIDIDNTIVHPGKNKILGSDQWVTHMLNQQINQGYSYAQALDVVLPLYYQIQHTIWLEPVEHNTVAIIKQLQERGVTVIALTIRSLPIVDRTLAQLKSIGIDFSHSGFAIEQLIGDAHRSYHYKNGILFCNGQDKGVTLKKVVDYLNFVPTKIIAIDDKEKYLQEIARAFDAIDFIGIRYGYCDELVDQLDPLIAQQELEHFLDYHKFNLLPNE